MSKVEEKKKLGKGPFVFRLTLQTNFVDCVSHMSCKCDEMCLSLDGQNLAYFLLSDFFKVAAWGRDWRSRRLKPPWTPYEDYTT